MKIEHHDDGEFIYELEKYQVGVQFSAAFNLNNFVKLERCFCNRTLMKNA